MNKLTIMTALLLAAGTGLASAAQVLNWNAEGTNPSTSGTTVTKNTGVSVTGVNLGNGLQLDTSYNFGSSYIFSGQAGSVSYLSGGQGGDAARLTSSAGTVMAWVNPILPATGRTSTIFSTGFTDASSNGFAFGLHAAPSGNSYNLAVTSKYPAQTWSTVRSSTPFARVNGEWIHVAFSFQNNVISWYLNGEAVGTVAFTPWGQPGAGAFAVAGYLGVPTSTVVDGVGGLFQGSMDELMVYNNAMTGEQIRAAAHIIPEPSAFGLLAGLGALALVASRRRRSKKTA